MLCIDILNIIKDYSQIKEQIVITNLCRECNCMTIKDIHDLPSKLITKLTQNILLHKKYSGLEYINLSDNMSVNDLNHFKNLKHITYSDNTIFDVKKFIENKIGVCTKKIYNKYFVSDDSRRSDDCPYCYVFYVYSTSYNPWSYAGYHFSN